MRLAENRTSVLMASTGYSGEVLVVRRSGRAVAVPLGAVGVLALLTASGGPLALLDAWLTAEVVRRRRPAALRIAWAGSALGEPGLAYPALVLTAVLAKRPQLAVRAGLAVLGGAALRAQLCRALDRARPPESWWEVVPESASFPSKHTTLAVLGAGATYRLLRGPHCSLLPATLPATVVVGASRVCLGVHWPTDALAGGLLAHGWLSLTLPGEG